MQRHSVLSACLAVILMVTLGLTGLVPFASPAQAAASLQVTPNQVAPGDTISVTGYGFTPKTTITLRVTLVENGASTPRVATTSSDASGSFRTAFQTPSDTNPGSYTLRVSDPRGQSAATAFTVLPLVYLIAGSTQITSTVVPGNQFMLGGRGFAPHETVHVSATFPLTNGSTSTISGDVQADAQGYLPHTVFTIPAGAQTSPTFLRGQGLSSGRRATAQVKLERPASATITLSPGTAERGQQVVVSGSGFTGDASVRIAAVFSRYVAVYATVTTDANGRFASAVTVPANAPAGDATITAQGPEHTASARLVVRAVAPVVTVQPSPARADQNITVTGANFSRNVAVSISVAFPTSAGTESRSYSVRTNNSGAFALNIAVPHNVSAGTAVVQVQGPHTRSTYAVQVQPASNPLTVTLRPAAVHAGQSTVASGTGFSANSTVTIYATFALTNGQSVEVTGSVQTNGNGQFAARFSVPQNAAPSTVTVYVRGPHHQSSAALSVLPGRVTVSLQNSTAGPGQTVRVTGSGFRTNDTITIYSTFPVTGGGSQTVTTHATTNSSGAFSASLYVPSSALPSTETVYVRGTGAAATATLTVAATSARITLSPATAGVNQTVTVTGYGFSPNASVHLTAVFPISGGNQTVSAYARTNGNGNFSASFAVPGNAVRSAVAVVAQGPRGRATAALSVQPLAPTVRVQPSTVRPGQSVTVSGGGFTANTRLTVSVTLTYAGSGRHTLSTATTTNGSGQYSARLTIPAETAAGSFTVSVTGPRTRAAQNLTVERPATSLSVSPASLIPGTNVQVKGYNFVPNEQVSVTALINLATGGQQRLSVTGTANGAGAVTVNLAVPAAVAGGSYAVLATGRSGDRAEAHFTVTHLTPSIVPVQTSVQTGTQMTVNGFGFAPGTAVSLTLEGQRVASAVANNAGRFSATFIVPSGLASGSYAVVATSSAGRTASVSITVNRAVNTHYYFASIYTGRGYHEYIAFVNPTQIAAHVTITYMNKAGQTSVRSFSLAGHRRYTEDVNADLGSHVSAAATVSADVPIGAERLVYHHLDGAVVPGGPAPTTHWYFANGNTGHGYREYIAVQNPNDAAIQVAFHFLPTHHAAFTVYRTMNPTSRLTIKVNQFIKNDAVGVIVTSNGPVVANRTVFIKQGMTSKTGATAPQTSWYFAAGPQDSRARNWIALINPSGRWAYVTLHAYGPYGRERGLVQRWLRPNARVGILINRVAHITDAAIAITSSQPVVAEQMTYIGRRHFQSTDVFGVNQPRTSWLFAAVDTIPGQRDTLDFYNPNGQLAAVTATFLRENGQVTSQSYIVNPYSHITVGVNTVVSNAYLGISLTASRPIVALNRLTVANGNGAMTSTGVSP